MKQSNIKKYIEVREDRGRQLNSQGVLFTEPQILTVFFPEFFKTAQSPELKLRNFATTETCGTSTSFNNAKDMERELLWISSYCAETKLI